VRRAALIIEGRTEIPAFCVNFVSSKVNLIFEMSQTLIAMTKGLLAAVELRLRDGSDGDTSIPICSNASVIAHS
jgi:hypothetical protein